MTLFTKIRVWLRRYLPIADVDNRTQHRLTDGMSRSLDMAVHAATHDFNTYRGRRIPVHYASGYDDEEFQHEIVLDPPAVGILTDAVVDHVIDEWVDPYWDFVSDDPRLAHLNHPWTDGPSYEHDYD